MKLRFFAVFIFVFGYYQSSNAQGCSDAGACTAGGMGDLSTDFNNMDTTSNGKKMHSYRITESIALGEENVLIIGSVLDVYLQLSKTMQFQIKGPLNMARKGEVKTVALGDIFLINTIKAFSKNKHALYGNFGVKLPTNQANLTYKDSILPMVYQSSLGSVDLIFGVNYNFRHKIGVLSGGFAYQQPIKHINYNKSPETLNLKRKADIVLRVDQTFNVKKKWDLGLGLLGIYHVKNDTYLKGVGGVPILGSKGLTLNVTGLINWYVSKNIELGSTFGVPLLVRDARPEGLTRKFVVSPYLQFNF